MASPAGAIVYRALNGQRLRRCVRIFSVVRCEAPDVSRLSGSWLELLNTATERCRCTLVRYSDGWLRLI